MRLNSTKKTKIGIIGIGSMGKGLLYQSVITPNIECVAICDIDLNKCITSLKWLGLDYQIVNDTDEMHAAITKGRIAVCGDGELIAKCVPIEVVIEASSSVSQAGKFAVEAIMNKKHLVLMNAEIDLMFGPYLMQLAAEKGVVYTSCDGDQYGVIKHLIDEVKFWGFELVMAGNIKGYLDRYANPTSIIFEAEKRNLDYRMCTSYTDGTKLCIEMAITANAFGLVTRMPGMRGPKANFVKDVFEVFDLEKMWNERVPFVDYILGAEPGGGVFVIGYCENMYQQEMLDYYKMGKGPFYLFYRPYHLCHIEAMNSVLGVIKGDQRYIMKPDYGFCTNVYAYAKRNLKKGEKLDGVGGYTCYGLIENVTGDNDNSGLPVLLSDGLMLKKDIDKDEKIYLSDVDYDSSKIDFELFQKAVLSAKHLSDS